MSNNRRPPITTTTSTSPDPRSRYIVRFVRHRGHFVVDRKTGMTVFGPVALEGVASQAAARRNGKAA